jgi:hypothetical protein
MAAIARHRLFGVIPLGAVLDRSFRIGKPMRRLSSAGAA